MTSYYLFTNHPFVDLDEIGETPILPAEQMRCCLPDKEGIQIPHIITRMGVL
jgi:hypothetical protein